MKLIKNKLITKKAKKKKKYKINDNKSLFILTLPACMCFLIWHYLPLCGLILAFKNYNYRDGILGSKWVGLKNFEFLIKSNDLIRIIRNTVGYATLHIILSLVLGVALALILFEINSRNAVKFYQTTIILPRFLSWVLVGFITYALLNTDKGVLNQFITLFGGNKVSWYSEPNHWVFILPFVHLWKTIGLTSIMYYAALMGIDTNLFEAAALDGASKLQQIRHISIPSIKSIIIILLILNLGNVFKGDFGLFYQIPRDIGLLYPTTDVIDTYVFRGLNNGSFESSTAVGLIQSLVGFFCIVSSNLIVKKIDPEQSLF